MNRRKLLRRIDKSKEITLRWSLRNQSLERGVPLTLGAAKLLAAQMKGALREIGLGGHRTDDDPKAVVATDT